MARRAWRHLRADLIRELCEVPEAASPTLKPLDLVRGAEVARRRLQQFEAQLRGGTGLAAARLASVLDLQRRHGEALELLQTAPATGATSLLSKMLERHLWWQEDRKERRRKRHNTVQTAQTAREAVEAVEILPSSVSRQEVWDRFLLPGRPCVIRGIETPAWTPGELRRVLGQRRVPIRRCADPSTNWASILAFSY